MSTKRSNTKAPQASRAEEAPPKLGNVLYRYKAKQMAGITNPNHMLFDGRLDGAIDKFTVLRSKSGGWVIPLSDRERAWITKQLRLNEEDLNTSDRDNKYLKEIVVEMPKGGLSLDLDDPYEFLIDRVLLAYDNVIAPNSKSKDNKRSYRYIRIQDQEEGADYLDKQDIRKAAYTRLGELEKSRERMIMLVLLDKVRINPSISTRELRVMVNKMADTQPQKFVAMLDDPLFLEKGIINMGVHTKAIEIRSSLYYFDELPLAPKGEVPTFSTAAAYLADKSNGDLKLALSNKVLDEFNRIK